MEYNVYKPLSGQKLIAEWRENSHERKEGAHPSVSAPVWAAGSIFRRHMGRLHRSNAVLLKKPPESLQNGGFQAVFLMQNAFCIMHYAFQSNLLYISKQSKVAK